MYKKMLNVQPYADEPVYYQEKASALVMASLYILVAIWLGIALHITGQKSLVFLVGDSSVLVASLLILPLVYRRQFKLAANLTIWAMFMMVILNNLVTDYLYANLLIFFLIGFIAYRLSHTFHKLIDRLEAESSKVKAYNRELEEKVLARTEALEKQNKELKKVNEELDHFVYSVSHDLRAPLASVLGLINISRKETDIVQIKTYLDLKEKSVKRLDNFVQDIVHISKNGRLEISREEIDFRLLIEEIIQQYSYLEHYSMIEKVICIQQDYPFVSDKSRLTIILNNLISNAIRYASPHRRAAFLRVSARITDDKAVIEVTDNGRGIATEHMNKIFAMFFRADHDTIGSGLGLYIVKESLEKLNGKISVNSELGKGSAFIFEIPNNAICP